MYLTIVLIYLAVITAIGVLYKRHNEGIEDFAVACRSLGTLILVGTFCSTMVGGATDVGWTGSFYLLGIDWSFSAIGGILGILLAATVLAEKFRKMEQMTVPDMLAIRYDNRSRYVSSIMIIIGDIAVITVQILSMTGILVVFIGLTELPAMIISVVSFTLITYFGGMKGVAVTDSLQAILIFFGLLAGVIMLFYIGGGMKNVYQGVPDNYFTLFSDTTGLGAFNMAIAAFGTTAVSQSIIFGRVFSAKDSKTAKRSLYLLIPTMAI